MKYTECQMMINVLWRNILKEGSPRGQRVTILYNGQRTFSDKVIFEKKVEGSKGASCKDQ